MDPKVEDARKNIEYVLAPYGYYLHAQGEENKLKLGFTELGLFALWVLLWGITEYAKAYISERAKLDAQRALSQGKPEQKNLQEQIDNLVNNLRQLQSETKSDEQTDTSAISIEELELQLKEIGFTQRAAQKAAFDIHPVLNVVIVNVLTVEDT